MVNDTGHSVVYGIALERYGYTDCMDCLHFSGGVMDFPYCKLNKVSVAFCRDYVPRGGRFPFDDRVWC